MTASDPAPISQIELSIFLLPAFAWQCAVGRVLMRARAVPTMRTRNHCWRTPHITLLTAESVPTKDIVPAATAPIGSSISGATVSVTSRTQAWSLRPQFRISDYEQEQYVLALSTPPRLIRCLMARTHARSFRAFQPLPASAESPHRPSLYMWLLVVAG